MFKSIRIALSMVLALSLFSQHAVAKRLSDVLAMKEAPAGVVFEVLAPSMRNWERIQPKLTMAIEEIRARFPDLDVAVVSHGAEQFALTSENERRFPGLHEGMRRFGTQGIDVHVCETFASWSDVTADAFPEYFDVSSSGPAQINDYLSLGYLLIEDFAF